MNIRKYLHAHPNLDYLQKVIRGCTDKEFKKLVLNIWRNPDVFEVQRLGCFNYGKIIYIIQCTDRTKGFFAQHRLLLYHLMYAEEMGFIPYVLYDDRFLYYDCMHLEETNGYEYYFEQPCHLNKKEILNSNAVIFSKDKYIERYDTNMGYHMTEGQRKRCIDILRKYVILKKNIKNQVEKDIDSCIGNKKTLGIHVRGTDFKCEFNEHPVNVPVEEYIQIAREYLDNQSYEQIFLATDEENIIYKMKEEFGDNLVYFEDVFRGSTLQPVTLENSGRKEHRFRLGYEVLRDMYALSICDGFIGGLSQVGLFAQMQKMAEGDRFQDLIILDKGIVHNNRSAHRAGVKRWKKIQNIEKIREDH